MIKDINEIKNQFRCHKDSKTGKYELYMFQGKKLKPVAIAPADTPFIFVATYDARQPMVAIRTSKDLYLINLTNGKTPTDIQISPAGIIYDIKDSKFDVPHQIIKSDLDTYWKSVVYGVIFCAKAAPNQMPSDIDFSRSVLPGTNIQFISDVVLKRVNAPKLPKNKTTKKKTKKPAQKMADKNTAKKRARGKSAISAEMTVPYNIQKKHNVRYRAKRATKQTQNIDAARSQALAISISREKRQYE